jgi:hypothetical protein
MEVVGTELDDGPAEEGTYLHIEPELVYVRLHYRSWVVVYKTRWLCQERSSGFKAWGRYQPTAHATFGTRDQDSTRQLDGHDDGKWMLFVLIPGI